MNYKSFDKDVATDTSEKTQKLGEEFSQQLKPGDIVLLYGELGAGKTTFTQGLAKGLGIKKRIISPTFVIVRTYRIMNHELRIMNMYHVDLYRTETENDLRGVGIEDVLHDKEGVVIIEWSEKMGKLLPKKRWEIRFQYENDQTRKITISKKE